MATPNRQWHAGRDPIQAGAASRRIFKKRPSPSPSRTRAGNPAHPVYFRRRVVSANPSRRRPTQGSFAGPARQWEGPGPGQLASCCMQQPASGPTHLAVHDVDALSCIQGAAAAVDAPAVPNVQLHLQAHTRALQATRLQDTPSHPSLSLATKRGRCGRARRGRVAAVRWAPWDAATSRVPNNRLGGAVRASSHAAQPCCAGQPTSWKGEEILFLTTFTLTLRTWAGAPGCGPPGLAGVRTRPMA